MSRTSALRASRHPAASVSSSIPPSISAAIEGKKHSFPASPDLNLTPHQLILGPTAVSHRSQLSRPDGSALEGRHSTWPGNTVMPSKLISLVDQHQGKPWMQWPGADSARHPPVSSECIHGHHSMAQGTQKMGTTLNHAQPSAALRFSGDLLAWSSLVTRDRAQGTAGDVSGKG